MKNHKYDVGDTILNTEWPKQPAIIMKVESNNYLIQGIHDKTGKYWGFWQIDENKNIILKEKRKQGNDILKELLDKPQ